ncbi:hypothetical protein VNI00_011223 [Paramarasmius palmivorus]|uniref:LOV domain-containing protein n=1 Tax=Paramarasmius palmivorus TaxID=297713 RepID=A0AAW0CE56_9AGAR
MVSLHTESSPTDNVSISNEVTSSSSGSESTNVQNASQNQVEVPQARLISRKRDADDQDNYQAKRPRIDEEGTVVSVSLATAGADSSFSDQSPQNNPRRETHTKNVAIAESSSSGINGVAISIQNSGHDSLLGSDTVSVIDPRLAEDHTNGGLQGAPGIHESKVPELPSTSNTPSEGPSTSTQTSPSLASNPYAYLTGTNPYTYYYMQAASMQVAGFPSLPNSGFQSWSQGQGQPSSNHNQAQPPTTQNYQQPIHSPQDLSRQPQPRPKRLKAHTVTTKTYNIPLVPRDTNSGKPLLPLNVGIMTVINLGEICTREHFHTERYIFPVGYEVTRRYLSTRDKNMECVYHCTILDGGDGPKFQIIPSDVPDQVIIAGTATGAWSSIVRRANQIRERQHSNSVSGPDFFGLGQNTIKHLIQQLPGADRLSVGAGGGGSYVWQNFVEGGPLGGRHASVIPALPEDYTYDSQKVASVGAWYTRRPPQAQEHASVNGSHYPPHLTEQQQQAISAPQHHQPGLSASPQHSTPDPSRPPSTGPSQIISVTQQTQPAQSIAISHLQAVPHQMLPNQQPDAATLASIMNAAFNAEVHTEKT